jgi:hypothetical protein
MTTSTKAWVARERWRAALNDYGADLADTVGLTGDAAAKRAAAANQRLMADAAEEYATTRDQYGAKSPEGKQAARRLRQVRAAVRSEGTSVGIVNNFSEPSDEDLEG